MRVLFVHSPADFYGASRSLLRLCASLRADGAEVAIVIQSEGVLAAGLRTLGAEVFIHAGLVQIERQNIAGFRKKLQLLTSLAADVSALCAIMTRWRPDIVHTNIALTPGSAIAAKMAGRPHLWHLRENFSEFPKIWPLYRRLMLGLSARVVANSQMTAGQFGEHHGRVRVLYNGLSREEFRAIPEESAEAWRRRLSPAGGPVIGVVGRIKLVRKGQEVFVQAAAQLAPRFPNVRFACIGGPAPGNESHLEDLQRMVRDAGLQDCVVITGDVKEVAAATAALDIAVMPSVQPEPFGNVVMEAMCLGKPVIGTSNGGAAEQIVDGVTGFLVPPGDAAALANAIAILLEDRPKAEAMGKAGQERFEARFTSECTYRDLLKLYEEVLPGTSPAAI